MPSLVDAYLLRKHGHILQHKLSPDDGEAAPDDGEAACECAYQPMEGVQGASGSDGFSNGSYFEVMAVSTFGKSSYYTLYSRADDWSLARVTLDVLQEAGESANVSLVSVGFLGCAPLFPEKAISLDTLELYHRLRRRHGQLSIQTMARTLCDLHDVSIAPLAWVPLLTTNLDYLQDILPRPVLNSF